MFPRIPLFFIISSFCFRCRSRNAISFRRRRRKISKFWVTLICIPSPSLRLSSFWRTKFFQKYRGLTNLYGPSLPDDAARENPRNPFLILIALWYCGPFLFSFIPLRSFSNLNESWTTEGSSGAYDLSWLEWPWLSSKIFCKKDVVIT